MAILVVGMLSLLLVAPGVARQVPIPSHELTAAFAFFDAKATLGDFRGRTTTVAGQLMGADRLADVRGWVEVDIASISTENDRRDRQLRELLDVERFPTFRLDLRGVRPDSISGDTTRVTLRGMLSLHGVALAVEIAGRVYWDAGGAHLWAEFPVDIRDYNLKPPSIFLGLFKMDPVVQAGVEVIFGLPATLGRAGVTRRVPQSE